MSARIWWTRWTKTEPTGNTLWDLVTDIDKLLGLYPTPKMFEEMNSIYNILYPENLPEY